MWVGTKKEREDEAVMPVAQRGERCIRQVVCFDFFSVIFGGDYRIQIDLPNLSGI